MTNYNHTKHSIPKTAQSFQFSRAVIGLLTATLLLIGILVFSTLQNINRAQSLMATFLLDKGETIMRAIEAGSRATMRHHMGSGDPVHTVLTEYAKDKDIVYISIADENGEIIEYVGSHQVAPLTKEEVHDIFSNNALITKLNKKDGIFALSKTYRTDQGFPKGYMRNMMSRMFPQRSDKMILSLGLLTRQFDLAQKQDVRHAMFMGSILFLVGSAGLYFLFLYQKVRITSSNLADMKLYTENIIESIPVCIITLDADDRVVSCNRNTEELFGLPLSAIEGQDIHEALPHCSLPITKFCDSHNETEVDCVDSSGKPLPLRTSCSPLINNESKKIGKVLILRDMSSIKEMELQLERSRRMAALGKMAAGIAHEIRNPLGTLRGFAQYFGNQPETTDDGKNYSQLMISEIDRLNQTISGLLQFSRPRDPQIEEVEVDALFSKTVSMMEADLSSKEVNLHWQQNCGITFRADSDLLLQVLMNLFKNSINAIPPGGKISLTCRQEDHFTVLTISDNGSGMSEEVRQKMFDPFFTTMKTGTGLGLAVSHQIIEQHGGAFEVQTAPEKGTSISIRLPK